MNKNDLASPDTDGRAAMLGVLMGQALAEGVSTVTLRALTEEAAEAGAARALARIGLSDGRAGADMHELRELLSAWRDVRQEARRALVGWAVRLVLALLAVGVAVKLKLLDWVR